MEPTEIEIKAEKEQTRIYSDGSAHSDEKKGRVILLSAWVKGIMSRPGH